MQGICFDCGKGTRRVKESEKTMVYYCEVCRRHAVNDHGYCIKCLSRMKLVEKYKLEDYEGGIPNELCHKCKKRFKTYADEVERGGCSWYCMDCKSIGVFLATAEISIAMREKGNRSAIMIDKRICPLCS